MSFQATAPLPVEEALPLAGGGADAAGAADALEDGGGLDTGVDALFGAPPQAVADKPATLSRAIQTMEVALVMSDSLSSKSSAKLQTIVARRQWQARALGAAITAPKAATAAVI